MEKSISIILVIITSILFFSCNGSELGNWSESDKQKFHKEMEGIEELDDFCR